MVWTEKALIVVVLMDNLHVAFITQSLQKLIQPSKRPAATILTGEQDVQLTQKDRASKQSVEIV